jgi:hypothetical protein
VPDFQKDPSPTQVPNQRDRSLADLIEQEGDIHFPPTPQGEHGRESILPDMSLEEMHMRFQLLDEDEKTFVRDSLEFGFRHHRNRRGLLSSDDDDIERQRRMTYNSDATFGDSMWEDDEEEKIDDNVSMNDEGAPSVPHIVDHHHKLSRESTDEIDLTTQVQELAAKKEQQLVINFSPIFIDSLYTCVSNYFPCPTGKHYQIYLSSRHHLQLWNRRMTWQLILMHK